MFHFRSFYLLDKPCILCEIIKTSCTPCFAVLDLIIYHHKRI